MDMFNPARPPPILTDQPPLKRARIPQVVNAVSPLHGALGGQLNACYDPVMILKAAQFPHPLSAPLAGSSARVVTPQRGAALPSQPRRATDKINKGTCPSPSP
jgi:hypothetical protein